MKFSRLENESEKKSSRTCCISRVLRCRWSGSVPTMPVVPHAAFASLYTRRDASKVERLMGDMKPHGLDLGTWICSSARLSQSGQNERISIDPRMSREGEKEKKAIKR
ncbi:hypothetical protein Trydic_g1615 [Trypoxylus dichotomus]